MTAHWRAQCLLNQFRASVYKFCDDKKYFQRLFNFLGTSAPMDSGPSQTEKGR